MNILEIYPKISNKYIPLSLLDVSTRNYIHWKKENLLFRYVDKPTNTIEKRERILLNVFDAFWISIVKELREFNVDFPTIRAVKEVLYANAKFNEELLDATPKGDFINSILNKIPESHRESFKPYLLDGSFIDLLKDFIDEKTIYLFKNIGVVLFDILYREYFVSLVIAKEDEHVITQILRLDSTSKSSITNTIDDLYSNYLTKQTILCIPLTNLVWKMFEDPNFEKYNTKYDFFTENEQVILEALNNDDCKEIKVYKHDSGDMSLNLMFEENVKNEKANEVRKILGLKQYEKMELTYRNNNHITIKNQKKIILKNQ
jgi:hypothetical protein